MCPISCPPLKERDNRLLYAMVERVLSTPGFYYSYSYDLTHSQQRKKGLLRSNPDFFKLPLYERVSSSSSKKFYVVLPIGITLILFFF